MNLNSCLALDERIAPGSSPLSLYAVNVVIHPARGPHNLQLLRQPISFHASAAGPRWHAEPTGQPHWALDRSPGTQLADLEPLQTKPTPPAAHRQYGEIPLPMAPIHPVLNLHDAFAFSAGVLVATGCFTWDIWTAANTSAAAQWLDVDSYVVPNKGCMTRRFIQCLHVWKSSSSAAKNTTVLCKFSQLNLVKRTIVFPLVLTHPHACHPEAHISKTGKEMEKGRKKSAVLMTPAPR
ncbi:hypothetical protein HDV64DRAFT_137686 [Trichoderma sp. TUCIM 5745]